MEYRHAVNYGYQFLDHCDDYKRHLVRTRAAQIKKELEDIWNNYGCLMPHHKCGFVASDDIPVYHTKKKVFSLERMEYTVKMVERKRPIEKHVLPDYPGLLMVVRGTNWKLPAGWRTKINRTIIARRDIGSDQLFRRIPI